MNHILNCGYEIKSRFDPRSYERNFSNCEERPKNFRTSLVLIHDLAIPVRCFLINCAMKPQMVGGGHSLKS